MRNAMMLNTHLSIKMLVHALEIVLIGCIAVPAAIAQPTTPPSATPPKPTPEQPQPTPVPKQLQQNSYLGFGGGIGIQGNTTSLSQGNFAILSKYVLTNNLAIHSTNTIFGSLTASSSTALTFNQPISIDGMPIVFIPFIGGGIMTDYDNSLRVSPHLTAGIDLDTPTNISATLRINAGFVRDRKADVGVVFGLGFKY
jgi:hypothetical protein